LLQANQCWLNSHFGGKWIEMARTNGAAALVDALGSWSAGPGPLYAQLAEALDRSLERGDLVTGGRLPSERQLSTALGVSRTTVVAAYDQLRASGRLRSHRGSGTRVARAPAQVPTAAPAAMAMAPRVGAERVEAQMVGIDEGPFAFSPHGDDIELTIGALPGAELIAGEAELVAREDLPGLLRSFGYVPFGHPPLRAAVAAHMNDLGIPTDPERVLITSGSQQAIDLLARHFGGPGASVVIEDPSYPPAIDVFRATGAQLVPVKLDGLGIRPDELRQAARRRGGQIAYLNPICQNPTGTTPPEDRRRDIARLASETGLLVIDDLTSAYLTFSEWPPAPLGSFDRDDQVITVGSLSKVAWGGLRIGWVRAPRAIIAQLAARKIDLDFSTSLFNQALAVRLFGRMNELVRLARQGARDRLAAVEAELRLRLPDWSWASPSGGLCLWIQLPSGDAASFARLAAEHGAVVRPGPLFSAAGGSQDRLRLAYGHDPGVLEEAVRRLAEAWAEYRPSQVQASRRVVITV
jgi:DNA-binding transcriptional MocR family regulator